MTAAHPSGLICPFPEGPAPSVGNVAVTAVTPPGHGPALPTEPRPRRPRRVYQNTPSLSSTLTDVGYVVATTLRRAFH